MSANVRSADISYLQPARNCHWPCNAEFASIRQNLKSIGRRPQIKDVCSKGIAEDVAGLTDGRCYFPATCSTLSVRLVDYLVPGFDLLLPIQEWHDCLRQLGRKEDIVMGAVGNDSEPVL